MFQAPLWTGRQGETTPRAPHVKIAFHIAIFWIQWFIAIHTQGYPQEKSDANDPAHLVFDAPSGRFAKVSALSRYCRVNRRDTGENPEYDHKYFAGFHMLALL